MLLENHGVRIELVDGGDISNHLRLGWVKVEGENPPPKVPKNLKNLTGDKLEKAAADQGVQKNKNMTDAELVELLEESGVEEAK